MLPEIKLENLNLHGRWEKFSTVTYPRRSHDLKEGRRRRRRGKKKEEEKGEREL